MSSQPRQAEKCYAFYSRRVASLMAWLDCERASQKAAAFKPENVGQLWGRVGDLE